MVFDSIDKARSEEKLPLACLYNHLFNSNTLNRKHIPVPFQMSFSVPIYNIYETLNRQVEGTIKFVENNVPEEPFPSVF